MNKILTGFAIVGTAALGVLFLKKILLNDSFLRKNILYC
jgi:hypothetical protein